MNLAKFAVERSVLTQVITFLVLVGGVFSFFQLGQLEDPDFTVKIASFKR